MANEMHTFKIGNTEYPICSKQIHLYKDSTNGSYPLVFVKGVGDGNIQTVYTDDVADLNYNPSSNTLTGQNLNFSSAALNTLTSAVSTITTLNTSKIKSTASSISLNDSNDNALATISSTDGLSVNNVMLGTLNVKSKLENLDQSASVIRQDFDKLVPANTIGASTKPVYISNGVIVEADPYPTKASLGLANAIVYKGLTTSNISDGSTTGTITLDGASYTASTGDIVIKNSKEFLWNGTKWEELGDVTGIDLSGYKSLQGVVNDPTASGDSTEFIATISQNAQGVITATKKTVTLPSSLKNPNAIAFKENNTNKLSYTGETAKSVNIISGNGVSVSSSVSDNDLSYTVSHSNSVTANSNYPTGTSCNAANGSIVVRDVKYDGQGHITSTQDRTINITVGQATADITGGIRIGSQSGNPVKLDSNGKAYVELQTIPNYVDTNYYPTSFSWNSGTGNGPTGSLTVSGTSAVSFGAIPAASSVESGIVTTGTQSFAGEKTFSNKVNSASGFFETSDERLKNFEDDINIDFKTLAKIPKKYFTWIDDESKERQIGTSAQAIKEVYPELVNEQEDGTLSVSYDKLSVIALKAVDELYNKYNELEERMSKLENR